MALFRQRQSWEQREWRGGEESQSLTAREKLISLLRLSRCLLCPADSHPSLYPVSLVAASIVVALGPVQTRLGRKSNIMV